MNRISQTTRLLTAAAAALLLATSAQADSINTPPAQQSVLASADRALARGDAEEALQLLAEAREGARYDGDIARVESMRCRAFHALSRFEDAEAACTLAIDTRIAHWSDYNNRGAARIVLGNLDGAVADLQQANNLRRGVSAVRRNLSRAISLRAERQALAFN